MQKTFNQLQLQHLHFNALGLKPLPSPLSHKQQNKKGGGERKNNKQKDNSRVLLMCRPVLCTSNACRLLQKPRTLLSPRHKAQSQHSQ